MPAYLPSPLTDAPAADMAGLSAADIDQPMVGYECAMPWFQVAAASAADPAHGPAVDNPAA